LPVVAKTNSSSRVIKSLHRIPPSSRIAGVSESDDPFVDVRSRAETNVAVARSAAEIGQEARARAGAILAEAQAKASAAIAEAGKQARDICAAAKQEGFAEGHQRGREEGYAAAEAENRSSAARLATLAAAAENEKQRLLVDTELQLVDLALALARRIVGAELTVQPTIVAEVVARAIEEALGTGHHVLRLHPEDAALLQPYLPRAAIEAGGGEWEVRPDESLKRGDCLIETAYGLIDACVNTQFEELTRLLRGGDDAAIG